MGAALSGPSYARPATAYERDSAGNAQGRLEATLHAHVLELIDGLTDPDWWGHLVTRQARDRAAKEAAKDGGPHDHRSLLKRLPFEDLLACFLKGFGDKYQAVLGVDARRQMWVIHTLIRARDAAGHPGKPYSSAEAAMAAALARELVSRIPKRHHEPHDLQKWLDGLAFGESEGWHGTPFDVVDDCPMPPELWRDLSQHVRAFRPSSSGGDGGFADSVEALLAGAGLDVFMRRGELTIGTGLPAASGLFHEHDLGIRGRVRGESVMVVFEMKHRRGGRVPKEDLLVFNQKTLDFFFAMTAARNSGRLLRAFVTNGRLDYSLHAWALGWGIVLVDSALEPIPVLAAAARDAAALVADMDAIVQTAERLGRLIRPLDQVLVASTLTPARKLLDLSTIPSGPEMASLVTQQATLGDRLRLALTAAR